MTQTSVLPIKRKALLIVVGEVHGYHPLKRANEDAKLVERLLIDVYHYRSEDIVVMMQHKSVSKMLHPSENNIRRQMRKLVQGVSAGDHLFFWYSGHSGQTPCVHGTESDGLDEVIFSSSGKDLIDNALKQYLVGPLLPGCKLFAVWDACHSGTILDLDHYKCNEPSIAMDLDEHNGQPLLDGLPLDSEPPCMVSTPARIQSLDTTLKPVLRGRSTCRASLPLVFDHDRSPSLLAPFQPRVLSPECIFPCNGNCPPPSSEERTALAHIVSLSACRDDQLAYDDEVADESFTRFFVEYLRDHHSSATLRQLLEHLRDRVDQLTQRRQQDDRRRTSATKFTVKMGQNTVGSQHELTEWDSQKPVYSSHFKLDLDERVDL